MPIFKWLKSEKSSRKAARRAATQAVTPAPAQSVEQALMQAILQVNMQVPVPAVCARCYRCGLSIQFNAQARYCLECDLSYCGTCGDCDPTHEASFVTVDYTQYSATTRGYEPTNECTYCRTSCRARWECQSCRVSACGGCVYDRSRARRFVLEHRSRHGNYRPDFWAIMPPGWTYKMRSATLRPHSECVALNPQVFFHCNRCFAAIPLGSPTYQCRPCALEFGTSQRMCQTCYDEADRHGHEHMRRVYRLAATSPFADKHPHLTCEQCSELGNTRWDPTALWTHRKHANFSVFIVKDSADLTRMIRSRTCLRILNPPLQLSAPGPMCSSCKRFLQYSSEAAVCLQSACRTAFCSACAENEFAQTHEHEHENPGAVARLKLYQVAAIALLGSEHAYALMVAKATARYIVNCLKCRKGDSLLFFEGLFCTGCKSEGLCISCLAVAPAPMRRQPLYGCDRPSAGFNFGLRSGQIWPTRVPTGAEKPPGFMLESTLRPCHVAYEKLLDTPDPLIRLVRLHPGEQHDGIRFSIEMYSLSKCPPYEALSYCWGEVETPQILRTDKDELFLATENLAKALSQLRYPEKSRVLWADAICLNQEDEEEKSRQVKVMFNIYSQATQVLVWLGVAADKSDVAFKWIKDYPRLKELMESGAQDEHDDQWFLEALQMTNETKPAQAKNKPKIHPDLNDKIKTMRALGIPRELVGPMTKLRARPYFSRVWTVQEVFYAKDIRVLCGAQSVPWDTFVSAYSAFWGTLEMKSRHSFLSHGPHALNMFRNSPLPSLQALSRMVPEGTDLSGTMVEAAVKAGESGAVLNRLSLLIVLMRFWRYDAKDPRDKVYALLSLAKSTTRIEADYTKSVPETFKDVAVGLIADSGKLDVLTIGDCAKRTDLDLPSWAPDWRAVVGREEEAIVLELYQGFRVSPLEMPYMRKYAASGGSKMMTTKEVSEAVPERKGNVLTLWGYVVGRLAEVAPKMPYIHHTNKRTRAQENAILACLLAWDKLAMDPRFFHLPGNHHRHQQQPQTTTPESASEAEAEHVYCLTLSRGTYWVGGGDRERTLREFRQWRTAVLALGSHSNTQWSSLSTEQQQQPPPPPSAQQEDPHERFFTGVTLAFFSHAFRSWSNYTLARTDAGLLLLGLGEGLRRDDRVVLLRGCDLPLVVRAVNPNAAAATGTGARTGTTGREELWQLVGAAYVYGMMEGEMWNNRECGRMQFV